jgi:metal-sulfur cluster biosynthetic enzyme
LPSTGYASEIFLTIGNRAIGRCLRYDRNRSVINKHMLSEEEIYEVLRECYDPEIPVNIVDLGLVYGVMVENGTINVQMTLTAPGCTMGSMIATEIEDKLLGLPDCERANVEIVWEPPWTPHRMSEAARKQLGIDD